MRDEKYYEIYFMCVPKIYYNLLNDNSYCL